MLLREYWSALHVDVRASAIKDRMMQIVYDVRATSTRPAYHVFAADRRMVSEMIGNVGILGVLAVSERRRRAGFCPWLVREALRVFPETGSCLCRMFFMATA